MTGNGSKGTLSGINVTPLIDVLLVLLIIFMVIQPSAVHGLDALAPHPPSKAAAEQPPLPVVVRVFQMADGSPQYRVDGSTVDAQRLPATLHNLFDSQRSRTLFVQGEGGLSYRAVLDVLNEAHRAGIDSVGLLTPGTQPLP